MQDHERVISSRSRQRRLSRTILLGSVAVAAGLAWLADALDMDSDELLGFAFTSAMLVGAVVVLALFGAALLRALKWLRRRDS